MRPSLLTLAAVPILALAACTDGQSSDGTRSSPGNQGGRRPRAPNRLVRQLQGTGQLIDICALLS
jgi:hypothetical protein